MKTLEEIIGEHTPNWEDAKDCSCGWIWDIATLPHVYEDCWAAHVAAEIRKAMKPHHYMNAGGFCHAGDMFEQGTPFIAVYSFEDGTA